VKTESQTYRKGGAGTIFDPQPPTPKQAKAYGSLTSSLAPLPPRGLTQYWINKPKILTAKLRTLAYRPAEVVYNSGNRFVGEAMSSLGSEGLVEMGACPSNLLGSENLRNIADLMVLNASIPEEYKLLRQAAKDGITVIAITIIEDKEMFAREKNVFTFSGNRFSSYEIERFIRDVLFQIRDRLYCGELE
jgi:hypothetical protein